MRKIAILIVMSMILSMAACSKGNEVQNKNQNKTENKSENETENKTEDDKEKEEENKKEEAIVDNSGEEAESVGQVLLTNFMTKVKDNKDPKTLAEELLKSDVIKFQGATMEVEQGPLTGFDSDIKGFKNGVMFSPTIGTIPFVGYIFTVDSEDKVDGFIQILEKNANPRWNVCTEAEETIVNSDGNIVFFLMSPLKFEE